MQIAAPERECRGTDRSDAGEDRETEEPPAGVDSEEEVPGGDVQKADRKQRGIEEDGRLRCRAEVADGPAGVVVRRRDRRREHDHRQELRRQDEQQNAGDALGITNECGRPRRPSTVVA